MSNAMLATFAFAWLFSSSAIIGMMANAGFITQDEGCESESRKNCITYPNEFQWGQNESAGTDDTTFAQRYASCATNLVSGIFNFLTFGILCAITTATVDTVQGRWKIPVISEILQVVTMAVGTIVFLFQISTFSITSLPAIVSIIIYGPTGVGLIVVAVSIARGSGD